MGAEAFEQAHGVVDELGDLRIDIGIAQRRAEGDAQALDALLEFRCVVGTVIGQRVPVAGIGLGDDIHHQG